jgi:hypothetical protein
MKFVDWLMPTETVAGVKVMVWMVFVLVVVDDDELPPQAISAASIRRAAIRAAGANRRRIDDLWDELIPSIFAKTAAA